jgi:hypothetical protein
MPPLGISLASPLVSALLIGAVFQPERARPT